MARYKFYVVLYCIVLYATSCKFSCCCTVVIRLQLYDQKQCVYTPKFDTLQWLTVTAKMELLLNMVWCFVVYSVQLPVCWIFCLPWLFQSFCLSQFIPVLNFQYWSCKSWVSVLVLDIKVLVLVLVLELLSLGLGLGLGLESAESWSWSWSWISKSWSWSWSWISKSWIQVWWSPIPVLTGLDVEQLCWSRPTHYHCVTQHQEVNSLARKNRCEKKLTKIFAKARLFVAAKRSGNISLIVCVDKHSSSQQTIRHVESLADVLREHTGS